MLFLHLRAPSGEALFELSRAAVAAFLRQTEALVPSGTESALLDLDDELHVLLTNGGPDLAGSLTCAFAFPADVPGSADAPPWLEGSGPVG